MSSTKDYKVKVCERCGKHTKMPDIFGRITGSTSRIHPGCATSDDTRVNKDVCEDCVIQFRHFWGEWWSNGKRKMDGQHNNAFWKTPKQ